MAEQHPLVCRFGAFGDMVLLTPLLRHLYRRSGLPCDLVAIGTWNHALFANMPYVRRIYTIASRSTPYWFNPAQRQLVADLRKAGHRHAWVCETDRRSYRLLARAGIDRHNSVCETDLPRVEQEHYCDKWLRLANLSPPGFEAPVLEAEPADTELFVNSDEIVECRYWLQQRRLDPEAPIVCIQAGSKRTMRRGRPDRSSNHKYWAPANWTAVIEGVLQRLPQAQVLLCGVPAEADMCADILAECSQTARVHIVADDLPMRRLLALLSIAHSCISVDTGPAHAAAALNCPLTVLFGTANPNRFRPVSAHSPVIVLQGRSSAAADEGPHIGLISPERVLTAWSELRPESRQPQRPVLTESRDLFDALAR